MDLGHVPQDLKDGLKSKNGLKITPVIKDQFYWPPFHVN